jgi:hypothetical protein
LHNFLNCSVRKAALRCGILLSSSSREGARLPTNKSRSAKLHQAKPRPRRLIAACAVAFAVLLLLLRLFAFVYRHGRR